jgi:hypothetical protein
MALFVPENENGTKYTLVLPSTLDLPPSLEVVEYRLQKNANKYLKSYGVLFVICLFINSVTLFQLIQALFISIIFWSGLIILYPAEGEEKVWHPSRRKKMKEDVSKLRDVRNTKSVESPV